jgi:hypothetical protein
MQMMKFPEGQGQVPGYFPAYLVGKPAILRGYFGATATLLFGYFALFPSILFSILFPEGSYFFQV